MPIKVTFVVKEMGRQVHVTGQAAETGIRSPTVAEMEAVEKLQKFMAEQFGPNLVEDKPKA